MKGTDAGGLGVLIVIGGIIGYGLLALCEAVNLNSGWTKHSVTVGIAIIVYVFSIGTEGPFWGANKLKDLGAAFIEILLAWILVLMVVVGIDVVIGLLTDFNVYL